MQARYLGRAQAARNVALPGRGLGLVLGLDLISLLLVFFFFSWVLLYVL